MADEDDFDFDEMMQAFDAGAEILASESKESSKEEAKGD